MKSILLLHLLISILTVKADSFVSNCKLNIQDSNSKTQSSIKKDSFVSKNSEIKVFVKTNNITSTFKDIFPILTLLLGIAINRIIDYLYERKGIIKAGERWKAEFQSLENPINKIVKYINDFLTEHNKDKLEIPQLTIPHSLSCENFNSLSNADLVKYFEKIKNIDYNNSVKNTNTGTTFIAILKYNYETLNKRFNSYLEGVSQHTSIFNSNLQLLQTAIIDYGIDIENETKIDPMNDAGFASIFKLFQEHIYPHIESSNFELFSLEKDFLKPLIEKLGHLRLDGRTTQLRQYSFNCVNEVKAIKMEKKYLSQNLQTIKERYVKEQDELKKVNELFK